jgi:acyl-CoA thioesterase-1
MSSVALHFASGAALFSGAALLAAAVATVSWGRHRLLRAAGRLGIVLGIFAIGMSATPLPGWLSALWAMAFGAWFIGRLPRFAHRANVQHCTVVVLFNCTLVAAAWELVHQLAPEPVRGNWPRLVVVGDSLSAAEFTEGGDPWPTLLARDHDVPVVNLAFNGAMAGSAEKKVRGDDVAGALVILEIGGNDLLGATPADVFAADLRRLLQKVCRPDNAVIMLELPLPPTYNRFGEVQRRLAWQFGIPLIPKRFFAQALAGSHSTVDGLHLGPAGHRKMADMLWRFVGPALNVSSHNREQPPKTQP